MVTREEVKGHWNEIKGRVQERWGQLTEDDFRRVQGNTEQLVGTIQQKTGESRREIEDFLSHVVRDTSTYAHQASEMMQQYADEASEAIRDNLHAASESASELGRRVVDSAKQRPGQALAIAFGVGLVAGLCLAFRRR